MLIWYRFAPFLLFFPTIAEFFLLIRYVLTPVKPDSAEYQIRLYDFGVQFWTSAAAGSADFLAFGLIYSWLTVTLHLKHSTDRKRTPFQCAIICSLAAVLQLAALIIGSKLPLLQWILLEVSIVSIEQYLDLQR